jgi:hypothetical protein
MRDRYGGQAGEGEQLADGLQDADGASPPKNDWRGDNPAASGIKALPIGEHEPWPATCLKPALAEGLAHDSPGDHHRPLQRRQDRRRDRMQHGWHDGG